MKPVLFAALLGALLYGAAACSQKPTGLASLASGAMSKLKVTQNGVAGPDTPFTDAAGKVHSLAEFKGKVAVVNLWATWCAPCKAEIPSLARLQAAYADRPVAIVAVSIGKAEDETAGRAFIARNAPLIFYSEPGYKLAFALKPAAADVPTTLIYDRKGIERARLTGGADWSGREARAVIDQLLAEK